MSLRSLPTLSARARHSLLLALTTTTFSTSAVLAQDMPTYEGVDSLPTINLRQTEPYAQDSEGGRATTAFAEYVKEASKGKITMEIFWSGSLMGANENAEGIASGLADSGTVAPIYDPASFPIANWLTALGNRASLDLPLGIEALDAAHWEFSMTSPELIKEFDDRGLHMVGAGSGFAFDMLCSSPIKSLADFKGKRARAAGVVYSKEAEALGMVPVPLIPAEMYEAFQRGIVDCVILHPPGYNNFGLMGVDKKKYFVNLEFSGFLSVYYSMNKEKWDALPPVAKQILTDGWLVYRKTSLLGTWGEIQKFGAQVKAGEAEAIQPDADLINALKTHQAKDLANMLNTAPKTIADPKAMQERFLGLIKKWQGLLGTELGWKSAGGDVNARINGWANVPDYAAQMDLVRRELAKATPAL